MNILAIGDLHCPFEHKDSLEFVSAVDDVYACDRVVCLGDEIDGHAFSRYTVDPDGHSPSRELELAIDHLRPWYDTFPEVQVCESNHTIRPFKKAYEAGLPSKCLREVQEILEAPKHWTWHDRIIIDGVLFFHGEGYSGMYAHRHAATANMMNTVIGHVHANAAISHINTEDDDVWGMNVGCLINSKAYAFKYAKSFRYKPSIGVGVIENGVPIFIPMKTRKSGRWSGVL